MIYKKFQILFLMTILVTTAAVTFNEFVPIAEAIKSSGNPLLKWGSAGSPVCGISLCSEVEPTPSAAPSDDMESMMAEKDDAMMMEKQAMMMEEEKAMMMAMMAGDDAMMMEKEAMMMEEEKAMMMAMMSAGGSVQGTLTAPSGDAPFGGDTVGQYRISFGPDHVSISSSIDYSSSDMVLEGWLVDLDSDYKLSLGKAHNDNQILFSQSMVNPWIYDALVITAEPIGDIDPTPNQPVGGSPLAEPFGQ